MKGPLGLTPTDRSGTTVATFMCYVVQDLSDYMPLLLNPLLTHILPDTGLVLQKWVLDQWRGNCSALVVWGFGVVARNPPLICGPCVHTGHQNNTLGDRESLNKSTDDLGEYFGAEGSRSGVGALKAFKKKNKIGRQVWHSFCGTGSVFELALVRDFHLDFFPRQRIDTFCLLSAGRTFSLPVPCLQKGRPWGHLLFLPVKRSCFL